jgi:hypothetical protein
MVEAPFASDPHHPVQAHLVLGWDADRASIADIDIEFMPTLGYAVRALGENGYVLFESQASLLYPMSNDRAIELGILSETGTLIRRGQLKIVECQSVRPFIPGYAMADCVLANGRRAEVMTRLDADELPTPAWYVGKRPSDAASHHAPEPERGSSHSTGT